MAGVARIHDQCTGHDCFSARASVSASSDVFVNGLGAHRVGDAWDVHTCISSHDSVLAAGSSTVRVNGRALGRIGDIIACGSSVATGSMNVFSG